MNRIRPFPLLASLLLLTAFNTPSWGGSADLAHSPGPGPLKPVEMRASTLGGTQYTVGEEILADDRQFEALIEPLSDYETTLLLKRSESSASTAAVLNVAGAVGLLTGVIGLLSTPPNRQTGFWITAVGGGICLDIGGLFGSESRTAKFNCVQRYNRFARGEEQVLPKVPADERSLLPSVPETKPKKEPKPAPRRQANSY